LGADALQPAAEEAPAQTEAFRQALAEEVGYAVVGPRTVALVFGGFLLAALGLGLGLRRTRRPELLGWLTPAAALAAGGAFLALGESSRRAAPPTVGALQVVEAVPGADEAPVRGQLAVYRPESGPAEAGAERGGTFELDFSGTEGRARRLVRTGPRSWHWENVALPAGVRFAPFRYVAPAGTPLAAVAGFGPGGLEGTLTSGPFRGPADALLVTPGGRNLAVRLGPDGRFTAGARDVLPAGQFLAGAVLSDRQQRRQELYRALLGGPGVPTAGPTLLAWAEPVDMHFRLAPGARRVGSALLVVPLRLRWPPPGTDVTIPAPLVACRRVVGGREEPPPGGLLQRGLAMHLRFQLPAVVLPLNVKEARLTVRVRAPSRRLTISGVADGRPVELRRVDSPSDPVRVRITDARLLRPDDQGGLHLEVAVTDTPPRAGPGLAPAGEGWTIEYFELEVSGRTAAE
jgi:hypothetical protein